MDQQLKERLVGAAVLVVAGILFIPLLLDGPDEPPAVRVGLELPTPDSGKRTHTIRLDVPAERPATKSSGTVMRPTPTPATEAPSSRQAGQNAPQVAQRQNADQSAAAAKPAPAPEKVVAPRVEVKPAPDPAPIVAKPAPSRSTPAAAPPAGSWAVQVGSFSSGDNAKRLRSKLNAAGYATFQVQLVANDKTMHRVRVGPVKDRPAAEALAARLGKAGYPGRVVQVDE